MAEIVNRLGDALLDTYVETDEEIGPRVQQFEATEKQLRLLSSEVTCLRDASSATHAAHLHLRGLGAAEPATARDGSAQELFASRQEGLAKLSAGLAAHYESFVATSLGGLHGLAGGVAAKYKAYCNKVVETRRRKSQLQLLQTQKERSDLRTLERSLIPASLSGPAGTAFSSDMEGLLYKQSSMGMWWSSYARLDVKRKVLLFFSKESDRVVNATRAVALSKYVLAHELPEHHVKRAAAFELISKLPELPPVILSADGSLAARRWVVALQEAIDADDAAAGGGAPAGAQLATPPKPSPPGPPPGQPPSSSDEPAPPLPAAPPPPPTTTPSTLSSVGARFSAFFASGTAKVDELDRKLSGSLAEQSQRVGAQLAQVAAERDEAARGVCDSLDQFNAALSGRLGSELLRVTRGELEYHRGMVAHLELLEAQLATTSAADADATAAGVVVPAAPPSELPVAQQPPPPPPPPQLLQQPPPQPPPQQQSIEAVVVPHDEQNEESDSQEGEEARPVLDEGDEGDSGHGDAGGEGERVVPADSEIVE